MKVRESQIPEDSGKPIRVRRSKNAYDEDIDEIIHDEDDDEKKKFYKPMLHLPDIGFVISLAEIESIDKIMKFVEHPTARWNYGICINKNISSSIRIPRTNIEIWYEKEEQRDKRYDKFLEILQENGVKLLEV